MFVGGASAKATHAHHSCSKRWSVTYSAQSNEETRNPAQAFPIPAWRWHLLPNAVTPLLGTVLSTEEAQRCDCIVRASRVVLSC